MTTQREPCDLLIEAGWVVPVVPHGIGYAFENPRIEGLTPAQKHLLRFGPNNGQVVKQALRNIATALGIPKDRLPG